MFFTNKNNCNCKKMIDSKNLIALVFWYITFIAQKAKTKKQKKWELPKLSEWNLCWKTWTTKVHMLTCFSELFLAEKETFWRYLWMNTTPYYWSYIDFYSLNPYTSCIICTKTSISCIDYYIVYTSYVLHRGEGRDFPDTVIYWF